MRSGISASEEPGLVLDRQSGMLIFRRAGRTCATPSMYRLQPWQIALIFAGISPYLIDELYPD